MTRRTTALVTAVAALAFAASAGATAGPIGPLPPGPVTNISAPVGSLVSVALPRPTQGRVWRQAGVVDPKVLHEVAESDSSHYVVIVFKAVGRGKTKAVYALTKGETKKAYASSTFVVTVR